MAISKVVCVWCMSASERIGGTFELFSFRTINTTYKRYAKCKWCL